MENRTDQKQSRLNLQARSLRVAGSLIFAFAIQFAIVMIVAESIYPTYSVANNYISDLGVGRTGPLFDISISLLGIAVIVGAYFIHRGFQSKTFSGLVMLTGIGALLVGIFNESFPTIHTAVSGLTFIFGALTAIYAYRFESSPLKYYSVFLGLFSFGALAAYELTNGLGLGVGGMERMIVYPFLLWGIGFGGYLMGHSTEKFF